MSKVPDGLLPERVVDSDTSKHFGFCTELARARTYTIAESIKLVEEKSKSDTSFLNK